MIKDLVLDTHVLNEFIAQYFENKLHDQNYILPCEMIGIERSKCINNILREYYNEGSFSQGIIVTSSLSFIEIARQYTKITKKRYSIIQFKSFIEQPPLYLDITPIDKILMTSLFRVPKSVYLDGETKPIELADAIHCATYFSRDSALLITNDSKIKKIYTINII